MSELIILDDSNYAEVTAKGLVLVDFYADWCGPCKMMAPVFDEAKDVYDGKAVFAKINVDENKSIAISHKIMSIPTLLFYQNGQIADRVSGVIDKATLYSKIDALISHSDR